MTRMETENQVLILTEIEAYAEGWAMEEQPHTTLRCFFTE